MIQRPASNEYGEYYGRYINLVPENADLMALLAQQPTDLQTLLKNVRDEQAGIRPAPTEWSIKEVVGHLGDAERIFAYRGMCVSRNDKTPLPGFDQDVYMAGTDFNRRSLTDLMDEFTFQRKANVLYFVPLPAAELMRLGTASGFPVSVRAILYMMVGHVLHHIVSLKTDYKVQG